MDILMFRMVPKDWGDKSNVGYVLLEGLEICKVVMYVIYRFLVNHQNKYRY